eukprot:TRINITY_DN10141_c0_g1_i1.p1 TRINITY_DN10141_c0_g1~~TRINITY_DN10141_c0_g1_i1.p1  ORF type:complete len:960 (+),score=266.93 TRINITY_DN10141_c0_g1_i1:132-3011(+)
MASGQYAYGFRGTRLSDYDVEPAVLTSRGVTKGIKAACYAAKNRENGVACLLTVVFNEAEPSTLSLGDAVGNEYAFCSGARVPRHPSVAQTVHSFIDASTGVALPSSRCASDWERVLFVVHEEAGRPLDPTRRYTEYETAAIGAQVAAALRHLRANGIAHRCVAHDAVFVDDECRASLTGFAGALDVREQHKHHGTMAQNQWEVPYASIHQFCGAPATLPPEVATASAGRGVFVNYTGVDAYALGLVMHRMLSGADYPYEHGVKYATEATYVPVAAGSPRLAAVVKGLLAAHPDRRMEIGAACDELTAIAASGYVMACRHAVQWEALAKEVQDAHAAAADAEKEKAAVVAEKAALARKLAEAEWDLADVAPLTAEVEQMKGELAHAAAEVASVNTANKALQALGEDAKARVRTLEARLRTVVQEKQDLAAARARDTALFNARIDTLKELLGRVKVDAHGQIQGLVEQNARLFSQIRTPEAMARVARGVESPFRGDGGDADADEPSDDGLGPATPPHAPPHRKGVFEDGEDDDDDGAGPGSPRTPTALKDFGTPAEAAAEAQGAVSPVFPDTDMSPAPPPALKSAEGAAALEEAASPPPPQILAGGSVSSMGSTPLPPAEGPLAGDADSESDEPPAAARPAARAASSSGSSSASSPPRRAKPAAKKAAAKRAAAASSSSDSSSSSDALAALPSRASPARARRAPAAARKVPSRSNSSSSSSTSSRTAPAALGAAGPGTVTLVRESPDEKLGVQLQEVNKALELSGVTPGKPGARCGLGAYYGHVLASVDGIPIRCIQDLVEASAGKMSMAFEFRKKTIADDVSSSSSDETDDAPVRRVAAPLGGVLTGSDADSSSSSSAISQPKPPTQVRPKPAAKKPAPKAKVANPFDDTSSSDSSAPAPKSKPKAAPKAAKKPPPSDSDSSSLDFMPNVQRRPKPAAKKPAGKAVPSSNLFGDSSSSD